MCIGHFSVQKNAFFDIQNSKKSNLEIIKNLILINLRKTDIKKFADIKKSIAPEILVQNCPTAGGENFWNSLYNIYEKQHFK